jgi:hypothetical protein
MLEPKTGKESSSCGVVVVVVVVVEAAVYIDFGRTGACSVKKARR